jgi:hypothetical protein
MPFKKGTSGNPAGKKKGTENKRTKEQREAFELVMELLEARMTVGDSVINQLTPHRAAELYSALLNYKKPKLSSNTNQNTNDGEITINVKFDGE